MALHFHGFTAEVEQAVFALPASCLRDVSFDPPPDARREAAVRSCGVGRGVKLALRFEDPWWQTHGSSGQDARRRLTAGRLVCSGGRCACALRVRLRRGRRRSLSRAVGELARYFPEAARSYRHGWVPDWTADLRAPGVHSHFPQGHVLNHHPNVARPEVRVHFAGEHTSSWNGFLEGALESAERVRAELLNLRVEWASA